ncbi:ciliary microtubule associated protein 1A-like [Sarcoramphus papa]
MLLTSPWPGDVGSFASSPVAFHMLFFLGHLNHNPAEVPTYTCKGAKPPTEDSCSPGPHYYVEPSMTRDGKCVAPAYPMCGLPKRNAEILPGPSDCFPEKSNRHIYRCPPVQSTSFRPRAVKTDPPPGK